MIEDLTAQIKASEGPDPRMILAHLPSGYLLGRGVGATRGPVMGAALIGAVLPDFDMLWFHLVDQGSTHHHRYWPHIPGFWLIAAVLTLPLIWRGCNPTFCARLPFSSVAIGIHLMLDSVGGGILWGWPFSDHLYSLVTVPATQSHWVLSFLLHWTMLAELAIIGAAAGLFLFKSPQTT